VIGLRSGYPPVSSLRLPVPKGRPRGRRRPWSCQVVQGDGRSPLSPLSPLAWGQAVGTSRGDRSRVRQGLSPPAFSRTRRQVAGTTHRSAEAVPPRALAHTHTRPPAHSLTRSLVHSGPAFHSHIRSFAHSRIQNRPPPLLPPDENLPGMKTGISSRPLRPLQENHPFARHFQAPKCAFWPKIRGHPCR
jgi:hypothetical protein